MTKQLMSLAGGRLVLALEGGYEPQSTSQSAELCLRALLQDEVSVQQVRKATCYIIKYSFASVVLHCKALI